MSDPQKQADPFAAFGGVSAGQQTKAGNTPATNNASSADPFSAFGGTAVPTSTPAQIGPSDEEKASQTRQMLVGGLTGMPTPNMTDEDKKSFARGKAAGAISVPLVAGATIGATELSEAVPSVLAHTVEGVKAIGTWAAKNPVQAYLLFQVMKELVPGAKKAMGVIKGVPEAE
jgi:hypothetical protein